MSKINVFFMKDKSYSIDDLIKVSTHNVRFMGGFLDSILEIEEQHVEANFKQKRVQETGEIYMDCNAKLIISFKDINGICIFYNFFTNKYESFYIEQSKSEITEIGITLPQYSWGIKQRYFFNQILLKINLDINNPTFFVYAPEDKDGLRYTYASGEYAVKMLPDNNYNYDYYGVDTVIHANNQIIIPLYHMWALSTEQIMFDFFGNTYLYEGDYTVNVGKDWIIDKRPILI